MDQMATQLRNVIAAADEYRRAVALAVGVGTSESAALGELRHRGPLSPSALARRLGLASASVTSLLDRLELAGMVARQPHPTDRRSLFVTLTDRGRAAAEATFGMFAADVASAVVDAHPDHVAEFTSVLRRIAEALRARAADPKGMAAVLRDQAPVEPAPVERG
jgi:DNA-binding MarR family transcriptional regulator